MLCPVAVRGSQLDDEDLPWYPRRSSGVPIEYDGVVIRNYSVQSSLTECRLEAKRPYSESMSHLYADWALSKLEISIGAASDSLNAFILLLLLCPACLNL